MMKHVHLIGICGSGLSAIARLLLERGASVSGSDRASSPLAEELRAAGARIDIGHRAEQVMGAEIVVRSSAIPDDNVEVLAARNAGIPVVKRIDFLGELLRGFTSIAIAGTHGKTTTTAMTAWTLSQMGLDPSYIIGGVAKDLGSNAHAGAGQHFVIEADEYDRMFLGLHPTHIVVTNMEHDHPDCFPTWQDYLNAYSEFIHTIQPGGTLLICQDDPGARQLLDRLPEGCPYLTYGLDSSAAYRAVELETGHQGSHFRVYFNNPADGMQLLTELTLAIPGVHNVRNALAVLAVVHQLGLPMEPAVKALAVFQGTERRFDLKGEVNGIAVIDDYAHHPTAIKATLQAARSRYPQRRIWALWQPHTYSRTESLFFEFVHAFNDADCVLVTEVYAAREKSNGFSAEQVVEQIENPQKVFTPTLQDATRYLMEHLKPGDVLLVLSAGDAVQVSQDVLDGLKQKEMEQANGKLPA